MAEVRRRAYVKERFRLSIDRVNKNPTNMWAEVYFADTGGAGAFQLGGRGLANRWTGLPPASSHQIFGF